VGFYSTPNIGTEKGLHPVGVERFHLELVIVFEIRLIREFDLPAGLFEVSPNVAHVSVPVVPVHILCKGLDVEK
jgi:hypothetical protein